VASANTTNAIAASVLFMVLRHLLSVHIALPVG
jgi:hypothetical protein